MFSAYFDGSGQKAEQDVMSVAGFVSSVEKWLDFETSWGELLKEFGIEPPFHMTDFATGAKPYDSWKDNKEKRRLFMIKAVGMIGDTTLGSFGAAVQVEAFRFVKRTYTSPFDAIGGPYPWLGTAVILGAQDWSRQRLGPDDRLGCGFESGDDDQGELISHMRKHGVRLIPLDKKEVVPLQAADILAWEIRRRATDLLAAPQGSRKPARCSLRALDALTPKDWSFYDLGTLARLAEAEGWEQKKRQD